MEKDVSSSADPNSVRKVVSVDAPQAVAWRVFTQKIGTWWPLANYKIGKANAVEMRRIFDVEGDWGRLVALFARAAAESDT